MRARMYVGALGLVALIAVPCAALANYPGEPEPDVYDYRWVNMRSLSPPASYGTMQTALRTGDTPTLQVFVHSNVGPPMVSINPSALGSLPTGPVMGNWLGYGDMTHYPAYWADFPLASIGPEISDGVKDIFITATDLQGNVGTSTVHIAVDNVPPTLSLITATFATTSPKGGDVVYISGRVNGTGSAAAPGNVSIELLNAAHQWVDEFSTNHYQIALAEFASSTDGTFSGVPLILFESYPGQLAANAFIKIKMSVYDEAGNSATTSITVPLPRPAPLDPCATPGACVSNVLFLPGIKASRLYRPDYAGGTDKLWEPLNDGDVQDLYMNPDGSSARVDVYAKERDVIGELPNGVNIYKSFIAKMNDLKAAGTITDWEPIAYDWRLSLDDILAYGNNVQGRLYYSGDLRATSTPYVIQELKRLAATSKTGKVTIVAHSNGGLLAKRLTEFLGPIESARLIDKLIFVAVPQAGTPMAVAADLHGYDQAIAYGLISSKATARTFASASPAAYHLLPSAQYFTQVDNPVVTFDASLPDWIARYGATIHSEVRLHTFLTDAFGRVDPQTGDINQPIQLSGTLLSGAEALHNTLDNWAAPAGIELIQIAGWGVPKTVAGLAYKKKGTGVTPEASFTVDGDGTVVVPSALWTSTTTGVANYWMDLQKYNERTANQITFGFLQIDHANILEIPKFLDFLSDQITNTTKPIADYTYLSTEAPAASDKRLRYALHSPLTLDLYDDQGRHTGISTTTGQVEEQVPGTYYTEFGEVKYLFTDASTSAQVVMDGYEPGTFTFNIDQYSGDALTASTTFKDIPTTPDTIVTMGVQSDITTLSPMQIDTNGDGTIDATLAPQLGGTVTLDTTPPEIHLTFSTSTKALTFIGTDDMGTTTIATSTTYPALKRGRKEYKGTATTTVTVRDVAGNTTALVYTEQLPSPAGRDTIVLKTLTYNGATTTLSTSSGQATVSYKWRVSRDSSFSLFASHLRTASTTLESHYRPKKDKTIIMTKPQELDDADSDDSSDTRPTKQALPGMVVPYMMTGKGSLIISY